MIVSAPALRTRQWDLLHRLQKKGPMLFVIPSEARKLSSI